MGIPCEYANNKKFLFSVHSGADVSLVKKSCLQKNINLNNVEKKNLGDTFGGFKLTHGSVKVEHDLLLGVSFKYHVIHVIC